MVLPPVTWKKEEIMYTEVTSDYRRVFSSFFPGSSQFVSSVVRLELFMQSDFRVK